MNSSHDSHCQPELLLEGVGGDHGIFLQLAEIFNRKSAVIFKQMQAAAAVSDFAQLGRQSHSLKGTVGPYGADKLMEMLIQIEEECDTRQCVCDEKSLATIEQELNQVRVELQQFIDRLP